MAKFERFTLSGFLVDSAGNRERIDICVDPPVKAEGAGYRCDVRSSLLALDPHPIYSGLEHDAWARAFAALHAWIRAEDKRLVDERDLPIELPSPPRDNSWTRPSNDPDVTGRPPLFHVEGWISSTDGTRRRADLAVWPAFEEAPGTFCAPMRCGLRRGGRVFCCYGASLAQAEFLAFGYLRREAEHSQITDTDGNPILVPRPPEPEPIPPP